jgi:AmiR/NasT family two-component response regulator
MPELPAPGSELARLRAILETLPVIEQAKGIIMATYRCGPDEAFGMLRRASQDSGAKVHVLAATLVEKARVG